MWTKRGNIEVMGNPAVMIAKDRDGYIIDENRYVTYEQISTDSQDKQFMVRYFDNGSQVCSFPICGYPDKVEIFGKNLFVYTDGSTVNAFSLENKRKATFFTNPVNNFLLQKNRLNKNLIFLVQHCLIMKAIQVMEILVSFRCSTKTTFFQGNIHSRM